MITFDSAGVRARAEALNRRRNQVRQYGGCAGIAARSPKCGEVGDRCVQSPGSRRLYCRHHSVDAGIPPERSLAMSDNLLVVLEFMPQHLRASHEAAGNAGAYPRNGARRVSVHPDDAEAYIEAHPEWAEIVEDADPSEYDIVPDGEYIDA